MKTIAFILVTAVTAVCFLLFIIYEKKKTGVHSLVLMAVMTAMSVAGRIIFAPFPGFKPVTAIIVLAGMYLGSEAGFFCGALTALVSNFYFGQGPWTPFQMLVWGLIGILAGTLSAPLKRDRLILMIYGVAAGVLFSLIMDIYTTVWTVGGWSWSFYFIAIASAAPYTVIYAVSNVVFLLALAKPLGKKLERVVEKYVPSASATTEKSGITDR